MGHFRLADFYFFGLADVVFSLLPCSLRFLKFCIVLYSPHVPLLSLLPSFLEGIVVPNGCVGILDPSHYLVRFGFTPSLCLVQRLL